MSRQHFDIRELINESPGTHLFYVVGQGGVGKSYSTKKLVLENIFLHDWQFIYVRRWTTETMADNLRTVFTDIEEDPEVIEWWKEWADIDKYPYFHILPKSGWFWLVGERQNGDLDYLKEIGRPVALSKAQSFKGGTYNNFKVVFFDEFIADGRYVRGDREPELLDKIVNTVARADNEIIVIFCGNPDFQIEMNPYLKSLTLDYGRMQPNTAFYYDTKRKDGKILARNVCFMKLSGFKGERFLNEYTSDLWQTSEGEMRETGEVKTLRYMHTSDDVEKAFTPVFELVIETAVQTSEEFNRKIYCYLGYDDNDEIIAIVKRHRNDRLRESSDYSIFCRYDDQKLRRHDSDLQILRLRIPRDLEIFGTLQLMLDTTNCKRMIYADDDQVGTLFESIRDFDKLR